MRQFNERQKNDLIALAKDTGSDIWVGFAEDDTRTWVDAAIIRRGDRVGLVLMEGDHINVLGVGDQAIVGLVKNDDPISDAPECFDKLFTEHPQRNDVLEDEWWDKAEYATPTCPYCKAGPSAYSVTAREDDMPLIDFECSACDFHYQG